MPEPIEIRQQKADDTQSPVSINVDLLAGWPGLDRTRGGRPPQRTNEATAPTAPTRQDSTLSQVPADSTGIDLLAGWPGLDSSRGRSDPTATPTDKVKEYPVKNGVLEISYKDLAGLQGLPATRTPYTTLKITGKPADAQLLHWADDKGFYFFFKGGDEAKFYYYKPNLKAIDIDGQRFDVDRSRQRVIEYGMGQAAGTKDQSPFANVTNPKVDAVTYFKRMSQLSDKTLDWGETVLRQNIKESKDPYLRIYLADILTMKAMQPLAQGFLQDQPVTPDEKQGILNRLDEARKILKDAADISSGPLTEKNRFPQRNAPMPLAPGAFFYTPLPGVYYDPYYAYWGGSWDQAMRRDAALVFIRGLISSEVYKYFSLPPR